jgi:hypothetical protein
LGDGALADVEGEEGLSFGGYGGGGVDEVQAAHAERHGVGAAEVLGFGHGVVPRQGNFGEITRAHVGVDLGEVEDVTRVEFGGGGGQAFGFEDGQTPRVAEFVALE